MNKIITINNYNNDSLYYKDILELITINCIQIGNFKFIHNFAYDSYNSISKSIQYCLNNDWGFQYSKPCIIFSYNNHDDDDDDDKYNNNDNDNNITTIMNTTSVNSIANINFTNNNNINNSTIDFNNECNNNIGNLNILIPITLSISKNFTRNFHCNIFYDNILLKRYNIKLVNGKC